jgi:hypothetical protein
MHRLVIVCDDSRLSAIAQCCEMMEWAREMQNERRELIAVVGELDWLFELHNLLYDVDHSQ